MKTVKITMSEQQPWRPPLKVEVDGEEWNNVVRVGWSAVWDKTQVVTLEVTTKLEIVYE